MSNPITRAILENVSNRRLVEMPEGGDSPMGLLGQVLDTMTGLGWSYTETDYANDEGGYEFENWSPAGEDLVLDACYGKKDLSDDEKAKNLIEDLINYCDNFDVDEHVEMWLGARNSVRGVPQSARTLVEDAEDIDEMYQEIVKALRSINHPMNESYVYNWKEDIDDIEATPENDDIWYAVAEHMCETGNNEGYGSDPYEVMSNIINLFKISKRSRLYKYLLKWYGSEEKMLENVRDVYETADAIYFTTGSGYSIFDADLLGGNADGTTEKKFDQFVDKEEGLTESAKVKLTEAPEDISDEEEEYELNTNDVPPMEDTIESNPDEMSNTEYEEEAEDDAKDTVKDDIEEPFYATVPEFDELRDILPDLDYRLFLINDNMVCIGRLNGPDIEFLTSNSSEVEKEAEPSEANDKAEEVEERAEENEEKAYEYKWIKAPDTLDKFLSQVNVVYLSPDMSDEEREQYAGIEASHDSVMEYLMNELPEDKRNEEPVEEEPIEDIPTEEPIEEVPVEEPIDDEEEDK